LLKVTTGEAAFWHTVVLPLIVAAGEGLTVTVVDEAAEGPLQPFAATVTVAVPEKPGAQLTVPVVPLPAIVFPDPDTDHI